MKESLIRFGKKLVIFGTVMLVMAAALVLPSKLMDPETLPHKSIDYHGAQYSEDHKTLTKWPESATDEYISNCKNNSRLEGKGFLDGSGNAIVNGYAFPDVLEVIGHRAFADVENISVLVIPWGVTTIEDFAFADTSMQVIIPDTVTYIGKYNVTQTICFVYSSKNAAAEKALKNARHEDMTEWHYSRYYPGCSIDK